MRQADIVNSGSGITHDEKIDFVTEEGNHFEGTVTFKKTNMKDEMKIGALKAQRLQNEGVTNLELVDRGTLFTNHVIASLQVAVIKSPSWFKDIDAIDEIDLLFHIYGKYDHWRNSFRKPPQPTSNDGDSEASVGETKVETSEDIRG